MKKYLLTIIFVLIVGFSYSQNNNNIIIGIGQSDDQEIFNEIKEYTLKCKRDMCVITICEKQSSICVSSYQDGEDYLYSYTPSTNQTIDITLTGTLSYTGVFVTENCPTDVAAVCIAQSTSSTGNPTLCGVSLTAGKTYYIMIDTDPSPNCTPFNINVSSSTSPTCGLNYTISSIAYAPDLNNGTDIALPIDDRFSSSYIPIGFPFCFDGYQFTQLLVSSNGYIIFDPIACASNLPTPNATPGAFSEYSIEAAIPNTTDAPRNAILFPWQDIGPHLGGTIKYQILGTAPNRRFVLTFDNVPYFDCETKLFSGQLKLFETTNNIEIHLHNKEVCTTWTYSYPGVGILGLHNYNGTIAKVPAGHNFPTQWTANNEAWLFTCNCVGCISSLPIELYSFKSKCVSELTEFEWVTISENNNDYFTLEESEDGKNFNKITKIKGAGNSNDYKKYTYIYKSNKSRYYRLKQTDYDGTTEIIGLLYSECKDENKFKIYPNPANFGEPVYIIGEYEKISIENIMGVRIYPYIEKDKIYGLDLGVYVITINKNYKIKLIVR
ncbi:MAG: T9SS type A sorting domain-containing protein [Ignavibacteria bacterium]|nr:T9SS type A sorting domain-containing protein [Ignavibacteria bacterium]